MVELLVKILVLGAFVLSISFYVVFLQDLMNCIEPYTLKCLLFKALGFVNASSPGTVMLRKAGQCLEIKIQPIGSKVRRITLNIEKNFLITSSHQSFPSLVVSPTTVLRTGSIETETWRLSLRPVTGQITIMR
ncbi:MAG: hypothetical protein DRP33_06760 [Thermotogae bacterium]|nr:MAG: hypothetical protein DRP33_06760 [Thermotogota bacterium]